MCRLPYFLGMVSPEQQDLSYSLIPCMLQSYRNTENGFHGGKDK